MRKNRTDLASHNQARGEGKTYADLMGELRWLGPASVMKLVFNGNTRQCGESAFTVAQYLIERGFTARTDAGAGKYCSHFDLAVHTADRGWVSIDPTYIQFHAPNNEGHALDIAERKLGLDDVNRLPADQQQALVARFFEPTVKWSEVGMLDGLKAFELADAPHVSKDAVPSAATPPSALEVGKTWREHWAWYRGMADDLTRSDLDTFDLYGPRRRRRGRGYWVSELSRRLQGKRISGGNMKSNPEDLAGRHIPIVSGIAYAANPLTGFHRESWTPRARRTRSEATFLSSVYPRLWEEALKNTDLKIRVVVVRDYDGMGSVSLQKLNADARKDGEVVLLVAVGGDQSIYALEGVFDEKEPVGDPMRLSPPTPFMLLHNLGELLIDRLKGLPLPTQPARVDTWAGRRGALLDDQQAMADVFAKFVKTGRVAYSGGDRAAVEQSVNKMVEYLKAHPGVYDVLGTYYSAPMTDREVGRLTNPADLAGRHVPEKYLEGLPPELQRQRLAELTESRDAYHRGEFGELPTDKKARELGLVKLSAYRMVAMERGFDISQVNDLRDMANKALRYYGMKQPDKKVVSALTEGLELVYRKGLAAWQSGGHRPGATGQNWADARVASVLVGGKAAWTADNKQFSLLPDAVRAEVIRQLPQLYEALRSQGRKRDIDYIQKAAANPRHLSAFYAASSIYRWPFGLREAETGYPKPYSPHNPINRPWEYRK